MPVLDFNHFNLRAPAPLVEHLRDFYVDVLGLHVGWRPPFNFPGYWLYLGERAVLHLVETPPGADPTNPPNGSFDHIAFTCTGVDDFRARLDALRIAYRHAQVPGTALQQLFVTDPSGNGVELNFAQG